MIAYNVNKIREDFPILNVKVHGKPLIYLDNAATSQKPKQVIQAEKDYYETINANIHRGVHKLSEDATAGYEEAHEKAADFIGADNLDEDSNIEQIIFTRNTTESLNLLAYSLSNSKIDTGGGNNKADTIFELKEGDDILITQAEHHANLVPWQQLAKKLKLKLKFAKISLDSNDDEDFGTLDVQQFNELVTKKTKIVAVAQMGNVLGTINDAREIGKIVHENNPSALFIVDGAQSVAHSKVDVAKLGCDFFAFSGHKMLAPTGIGVLFGKKNLLEQMKPFMYGGDMIRKVTFEDTLYNDLPWKFEAGTPNIAGGIALGSAIDYLQKIGMENIFAHEQELTRYALKRLEEFEDITIYGPRKMSEKRTGIISFNIDGIHAHDVASIFDQHGIAIRGGHHCAMPLMSLLNVAGTARISFYLYNKKEEVDKVVDAIKSVKKIFA
ncbi:cysteine desulfurase [Candidatus Woesearchaeota archaeon]|nr:cysteine desulfurase [Candidatus Woesearchaeota archaeon]